MILDQLPPKHVPRLTLFSPVHGDAQPLHNSTQAIDKLAVLGAGVQLFPRTTLIRSPANCSVAFVSPDRRRWELVCSNQLRLRMMIHSSSQLPLANPLIKAEQPLAAKTPLFSLSAACLKHGVRLTLHVAIKNTHALYCHYGHRLGGDDPLISIFQQRTVENQTRENHK